jgi:hypothetical protein
MSLVDGVNHFVKGIMNTYVLIALCAAMLPFTFLAIDAAPVGVIGAKEITKLALSLIVVVFVIFRVILPGMEKTVSQRPPQDGGYNSYQTPPSYGGGF